MQQLLSIPDIRTVENGDTISFVVGGYEDLPEAIRRQLALNKDGVMGKRWSARMATNSWTSRGSFQLHKLEWRER
ncbi:MAG: hypothetical protein IPO90_12700 [Flavobacteriales bacterium]|nr:hypothetical protein [Flavobacteriales bacterium]